MPSLLWWSSESMHNAEIRTMAFLRFEKKKLLTANPWLNNGLLSLHHVCNVQPRKSLTFYAEFARKDVCFPYANHDMLCLPIRLCILDEPCEVPVTNLLRDRQPHRTSPQFLPEIFSVLLRNAQIHNFSYIIPCCVMT